MFESGYGLRERPSCFVLRAKLPLLDSRTAPSQWIQVAVEGTWKGHPGGEFTFTNDVFQQILANFSRQTNPLPLTFEHPERTSGQPVPAAGWIRDLAVRGNELWAFVEFTERAAALVKAGEYRFCSVVVDFESTDRESGKEVAAELFEVGLTNTPFLDGMSPIQMSRRALRQKGRSMLTDKERIAAAFEELGDDAELATAVEWAKAKANLDNIAQGIGETSAEAAAVEGEPKPVEEVHASAEAGDVIEAADMPGEEPAPEGDAVSAAAADALMRVAEMAGMDISAVIAAIAENPEALAAAISGAPPEAAGEMAASRVVDLTRALKARDGKVAELSKSISDLRCSLLERDITAANESRHILDTEAKTLIKLSRNPACHKDIRERLEEAAADPAIPGAPIKASRPRGKGFDAPANQDSDEWKTYELALSHIKNADERNKLIAERIATRDDRMKQRRRRPQAEN